MSDPNLLPGEIVIRKAGGKEYRYDRRTVWITLTNQRLIVERFLGGASAYPLARVTLASEYEYWPPLVALFSFKLLRIDFDNEGALLFGLGELPAWVEAIERARLSAPELPYTTTPEPYTPHPTQVRAPKLRWIWLGMIAISVITCCLCVPIGLFVLLALNAR